MLNPHRVSWLLKPSAVEPRGWSRGPVLRWIKRLHGLALFGFLVAVSAVPGWAQASDRGVNGKIRIVVTDSASHAAIEGAHVEVSWATSSLSGAVDSDTATTDSLGDARIGPLPRIEPVSITVRHPRYVTLRVTRRVGDLTTIEVKLRRCCHSQTQRMLFKKRPLLRHDPPVARDYYRSGS